MAENPEKRKTMTADTRLIWCGVIIALSIGYAILVEVNPRIAIAVMLGYIGLLFTIFISVNVWKKK